MREGRDGHQVSPRQSLDALTGARFLAALWVVVYHYALELRFSNLTDETNYLYGHRTPLELVILQGHLAVDFFFLLSGFILAYTYITPGGGPRGGQRAFWVARVARIYPVYLLGLALALGPYLASGVGPALLLSSGATHLLMLHAWFPATLGWNQPSWSLSVEAFFYALFPLLLPLFARLRGRGLALLAAGSWLAFALVTAILFMIGNQVGVAAFERWRDVVRYNPLVSLPVFTTGMALGLLARRGQPAGVRERAWDVGARADGALAGGAPALRHPRPLARRLVHAGAELLGRLASAGGGDGGDGGRGSPPDVVRPRPLHVGPRRALGRFAHALGDQPVRLHGALPHGGHPGLPAAGPLGGAAALADLAPVGRRTRAAGGAGRFLRQRRVDHLAGATPLRSTSTACKCRARRRARSSPSACAPSPTAIRSTGCTC